MKKYLLILWFLCLAASTKAQVGRPQFSQYMMNYFLLNPAVAGIDNDIEGRVSHRTQWSGLQGAPQTTYASLHAPIGKSHHDNHLNQRHRNLRIFHRGNHNRYNEDKPHHGIGLLAMADRSGALSFAGAELSYAYHQPITNQWSVSAGTSLGVGSYTLAEITTDRPNDPSVPKGTTTITTPNLHTGIAIYTADLMIGISANRMIDPRINFATAQVENRRFSLSDFAILVRYKYHLSKDYTLAPSVLAKRIGGGRTTYDLSTKLIWTEQAWFGLTYRMEEALSIQAGMNLGKHFALGYAYDYTLLPLQNNFMGSHEVVLGIRLHNNPKILSPQEMW